MSRHSSRPLRIMASLRDPKQASGGEANGTSGQVTVTLDMMMPLIRERLAAGQSVRIYPRGTSMLPMLAEGRDSVVLSPLPAKLKKYDLPLYQRKSGQYVLHRIVKVGESYTCMGDNQLSFETELNHEQMIAVVSSFNRKGRECKVTDIRYRFYCCFWYNTRFFRRIWRGAKHRIKRIFRGNR